MSPLYYFLSNHKTNIEVNIIPFPSANVMHVNYFFNYLKSRLYIWYFNIEIS